MAQTTANEKDRIRKDMLVRRAAITSIERQRLNRKLRENVLLLRSLTHATTIFCYLSTRNEVDTTYIIKNLLKLNKSILIPSVTSETNMIPVSYEETTANPKGLEKSTERPELTFIPVVAISKLGNRIGYGRGYYDRWLAANPNTSRVALAFDCQISDKIVAEDHDQKIDTIVTENQIIHCRDYKG